MAAKKNKKAGTKKSRTQEFVEFLDFFNKFVNHTTKKRNKFIEKDMRI